MKKEIVIDFKLYQEELSNQHYRGYRKGAKDFVDYLIELEKMNKEKIMNVLNDFLNLDE